MSQAAGGIPRIQEESLDGITLIEVISNNADLTCESDPDLGNVIQVVSTSAPPPFQLSRDDSKIRLNQIARGHGRNPVVVRLPAVDVPRLKCTQNRGDLAFKQIDADIACTSNHGDLHISGGEGVIDLSKSRGDTAIAGHSGGILCNSASGDVSIERCSGEIAIRSGSGDMVISDCQGVLVVKASSGDVAIIRPNAQHIDLKMAKGDLVISHGSVAALNVRLNKGDIASKTRFLLPSQAEQEDEAAFEWEPEVETVDTDSDESPLSDIEIEAGEGGLRITRGGREVFHAGEDGLRIAHGGKKINIDSGGVNFVEDTETARELKGFTLVTRKGDVNVSVPDDVSTRVELLLNRGDVSSDIPLVEVGRPGPKGATRRYVGATDTSEGERLRVRVKSDHGDINIRAVAMPAFGSPVTDQRPEREERIRSVLSALANAEITVADARMLVAAIEREY